MSQAQLIWRGKQLTGMVKAEALRRLNKSAVVLHAQMIDNISISTRAHGPSLPGGFPHADTGRLRQSVVTIPATTTTMTAKVGTNYKVARYLELGTRYMRPRMFLRRTLREASPMIRKIFLEG